MKTNLTEHLRLVRLRHRLSAGECAKRAGMSRSKLWRIESGKCDPLLADLIAIAEALGLKLEIGLREKKDGEG